MSRVQIQKNWESLNPWYLVLRTSNSLSYLKDGFVHALDLVPKSFVSVICFPDYQQSRIEEWKRIYFPLAFQIQAQEDFTTRRWILIGCSSFGPENLAFSFFCIGLVKFFTSNVTLPVLMKWVFHLCQLCFLIDVCKSLIMF